jgi:hypothetical protein
MEVQSSGISRESAIPQEGVQLVISSISIIFSIHPSFPAKTMLFLGCNLQAVTKKDAELAHTYSFPPSANYCNPVCSVELSITLTLYELLFQLKASLLFLKESSII